MTAKSSQSLVIEDLENRRQFGLKKYGVELFPHHGRSSLIEAYEEALDLACYLRAAMAELGIEYDGPVHREDPVQ